LRSCSSILREKGSVSPAYSQSSLIANLEVLWGHSHLKGMRLRTADEIALGAVRTPDFATVIQSRINSGEIIVCMDTWLQAEGATKGESSRLVRSPQQATPMTQSTARQAMHGAKRDYPEFAWEMESGFKNGEFVLHGQKK
jgi:hypothetical protein